MRGWPARSWNYPNSACLIWRKIRHWKGAARGSHDASVIGRMSVLRVRTVTTSAGGPGHAAALRHGDLRNAPFPRFPPDPGRHDRRGRPDRRGDGAISRTRRLSNGYPGAISFAEPGSRPKPGTPGLAGAGPLGQPHFLSKPLAHTVSATGCRANPGYAAPGRAGRRPLRRADYA